MEKIRFGIVGYGAIGPIHAHVLTQIGGVELIAICSPSEAHRHRVADEFPQVALFQDYDEMLVQSDLDAVSICTPSGLHADQGGAAARAGVHVLVEKPIDISLERADALIAACREAGLRLGVISQHRFDPAIVTLKRAIDQGRFGKLLLGDAYVKWHRTQEYYDEGGWRGTWTLDGGGAFINQSIHFIDLLRWLMGPVRTVWARTATVAHQIEAEDLGVAFLEYESGAFGVVEGATALYPGLPERIEIHGERGTVVVDGPTIRVWAFREGDPPPAMEDEGAGTGTGSGAAVATAIEIESHRRQIADFATAIREERDPAVTGEEGRRTLEIVTAIYRSARLGRPVSLFK